MTDPRVQHHIEDGGQEWVSLSDASISAEGFSVATSRHRHHLKPLPIRVEEVEGPGTHTISFQDFQAPGPVQGIL